MMMAIREKHPVNVPPCSSMRWMPSLLEMSGWAPVETMVSLTLLLHMSGSGEGVVIKVLVVTVVVEILWLVGEGECALKSSNIEPLQYCSFPRRLCILLGSVLTT